MERYTDVDLMILDRWEEVTSLMYAFDDLLGRMRTVVDAGLERTADHLREQGFEVYAESKIPRLSFWRPNWVNRREEGIYASIVGFAPREFGKETTEHPATALITEDLGALRLAVEPEAFGRAVWDAAPKEHLALWKSGAAPDVRPLRRGYEEVSESVRVSMVRDPDVLANFLIERFSDFAVFVPAIEESLGRLSKR